LKVLTYVMLASVILFTTTYLILYLTYAKPVEIDVPFYGAPRGYTTITYEEVILPLTGKYKIENCYVQDSRSIYSNEGYLSERGVRIIVGNYTEDVYVRLIPQKMIPSEIIFLLMVGGVLGYVGDRMFKFK